MTDILDRDMTWAEMDLNEINCGGRLCECDVCDAPATQALRTRSDMRSPPHVSGMVTHYYCQDYFNVALAEETRRYP